MYFFYFRNYILSIHPLQNCILDFFTFDMGMKYLLFALATIFCACSSAQNDHGFLQPAFADGSTIIDILSLRQNDCESDTTIGAWKSDDIWVQVCSHNWVYAEKDDVNEIRITFQSNDDNCPCECPYEWKEGRICSVCLRSEIRVISVKIQKRQSEYQKLIKRKKDRQ